MKQILLHIYPCFPVKLYRRLSLFHHKIGQAFRSSQISRPYQFPFYAPDEPKYLCSASCAVPIADSGKVRGKQQLNTLHHIGDCSALRQHHRNFIILSGKSAILKFQPVFLSGCRIFFICQQPQQKVAGVKNSDIALCQIEIKIPR